MKKLALALLILGTVASTAFAQTVEQKDRLKVFSGWLGIVRTAEKKYKLAYGGYGALADLRKEHLLDGLVFDSDSPVRTHSESQANFIPKTTFFDVTVSSDGQHFNATIHEDCVSVDANDMGGGRSFCLPTNIPLEDDPDGPIIAVPG